jgi:uncharacterized protein YbjQ (UPF0145 family)
MPESKKTKRKSTQYKRKSTQDKRKPKKGGSSIIISTQTDVPENYEVIAPGMIIGRSIRSMNMINSFLSGLSGIFGGKQDWTGVEKLLDEVREDAEKHLVEIANSNGADMIIGTNVEISELGQKNSLLICTMTGTMIKRK